MQGNGFCSAEDQLISFGENNSFSFSDPKRAPLPSAIITAAHPDDEVIGSGGLFRRFESLHFIHTTDGSPRNISDALASGYSSRRSYAFARRRELSDALGLAGLSLSRCFETGIADQEASLNMSRLIRALCRTFRRLKPALIFTPAYEGGHPDHDATALAVHAASAILRREDACRPILVEYALYHQGRKGMKVCDFLPVEGADNSETLFLNPDERFLKKKMFSCFQTQTTVLRAFSAEVECFRRAPSYDFCSPPHDGRLYYEQFDWGMTGERWRRLASETLGDFRIRGRI